MAAARTRRASAAITIGKNTVVPGQRSQLELPIARLATQSMLSLPVAVVHGRKTGPCIWLSAAVHGDEINGVEIIRRVWGRLDPETLRGTVIAVPIVNVFGFINESRYFPDRRDLNRSFPGSSKGSLAARMAHLFLGEIVRHCTHGIDLHTAALHRTNLPQLRANLKDENTRKMAKAFGAPVMIDASTRDGSLREAASREGIPVLVYEAGEAQRFNEFAISAGVNGVLRVMTALGMGKWETPKRPRSLLAASSYWVRARRAGLFRCRVTLGERVKPKQLLGKISDAFGENTVHVNAGEGGVVIGLSLDPLMNRGDAVVHIARMDS